jgi:hypothetical protein
MVAALAALGLLLASTPSRADGAVAPAPGEIVKTPTPLPTPTSPPPTNPALDLRGGAPERPSLFRRWWFWTAVGAAVTATVVIVVMSSRGHAPPATDLGNQEFRP